LRQQLQPEQDNNMSANAIFFALPQTSSNIKQQLQGAKLDQHFLKTACSSCNMRELCMPIGLDTDDLKHFDKLVTKRPFVKRGSALFRAGDTFTALYAVRSGFLKTTVSSEDGQTQVTGFQMAGEIVGLDGIATDLHTCDAIALEDTEVCALPFERIEEVARDVKALQHHIHKIMSREIVREHGVMLMLGNMRAEERLAVFLLNLVQRLHARGFSSSDLILRMTREEIGSYLGLTLETVSRTFSKFAEDGMITVNQRQVHIQDAEALKKIVNHAPCH
jgi:CRP/FNR family transcriptional regulator